MVENAIKEYGFVRDYVFDQAKNQVSLSGSLSLSLSCVCVCVCV